nr:antitoxin MazE-like protein [Paraburkholderia sp. BL6665CI2N2]
MIRPTDEEEAAIQRGIAADPDNPEWTAQDFAQARPFAQVMRERRPASFWFRLKHSRSARLRAKFAAECRREPLSSVGDPSEAEIMDFLEAAADTRDGDP